MEYRKWSIKIPKYQNTAKTKETFHISVEWGGVNVLKYNLGLEYFLRHSIMKSIKKLIHPINDKQNQRRNILKTFKNNKQLGKKITAHVKKEHIL